MQIYGPAHLHGAHPVNPPHSRRPESTDQTQGTHVAGDQLEISDAARIAARLSEVSDVRQKDRVTEIRDAIASGTYETEAKVDAAVEQLLNEIG